MKSSDANRFQGGGYQNRSCHGAPFQVQETLQLTTTELQNSLNLQCTFDAETVRTLAALSSPMAPLLLLLAVFTKDFDRCSKVSLGEVSNHNWRASFLQDLQAHLFLKIWLLALCRMQLRLMCCTIFELCRAGFGVMLAAKAKVFSLSDEMLQTQRCIEIGSSFQEFMRRAPSFNLESWLRS